MIDFTGRKVVIFGGGAVGLRKARYFAGEADVSVYSRSFHPDFTDLPVRKEHIILSANSDLIAQLIHGSSLVIAATSDTDLNECIKKVSRSEGLLCNVAAGSPGNVFLPAKISGEKFTIAISTIGSVPAVSRLIREELEESFPDLDRLVELGEWIRDEYRKNTGGSSSYESVLYQALRDPDTRNALSKGQMQAQQFVREKYVS